MATATANLRRQHREILRVTSEIVAVLHPDRLAEDASAMRLRLSRLAGLLTVHLSIEDGVVYPELLSANDGDARRTARQFVDEMGSLKAVFDGFRSRWANPETIQKSASIFVRETQNLCTALERRIEREERDLYPIVDRLGT